MGIGIIKTSHQQVSDFTNVVLPDTYTVVKIKKKML